MRSIQKLEERLASKIRLAPTSDCWLWCGTISARGYGYICIAGKSRLAHRVSYELFYGLIPVGLEIDHICRVRNCINPKHLRTVTHNQNMMADGSLNIFKRLKEQTHCIHGHLFSVENTRIKKNGGRICKECNRQYTRESLARKKARL